MFNKFSCSLNIFGIKHISLLDVLSASNGFSVSILSSSVSNKIGNSSRFTAASGSEMDSRSLLILSTFIKILE